MRQGCVATEVKELSNEFSKIQFLTLNFIFNFFLFLEDYVFKC